MHNLYVRGRNMTRLFSDEELKSIIEAVFNHYKKRNILKREFHRFLSSKGFSDEDIEAAWFQAYKRGLVETGICLVGTKPELVMFRPKDFEED
ncbi:MAG: hypothetical protein DRJ60_05845 [Thermoprotei archaeon]|nr:MAG: hypothetical protein DRJ60_05845 [Thermoprotei archaeon]